MVRSPWPAAISVPLRFIYGIYAALLFVVVALTALLAVLFLPTLKLRRGTARIAARSYFLLAGMPLRLRGTENLPAGQCVVVANHASYLDGVVMAAALPPRFAFVIKREMNEVPVAGLLLRRIGSEFVDRFNRHAGGMDARRLLKAADAGQALAFFPEGTFLPEPGLGKFHSGAFTIAARVDLPVVPLAIRGTRSILPSGRFLPRPGRIDIHVLPSVGPMRDMKASDAVIHTRDVAHARILAELGEPDLSSNDGIAALQSRRS